MSLVDSFQFWNYMKECEIKDLGQTLWIPCLSEMESRDIKFQTWIQDPGDVSYTAPGVIHWVLNPVSLLFIFNNEIQNSGVNFSWDCLFMNSHYFHHCFSKNEDAKMNKSLIALCMLRYFNLNGTEDLHFIMDLIASLEDELDLLTRFEVS
jgi:hypothetical protein